MGSYVPSTQAQREQMLRAVGLENIMDLYRDVPEQMLLRKPLNIPDGMSELEASRAVSAMAAENRTYATVLRGAGAYDHYIPSIVKYIPAKEEFLTAYTPYQAEMSQGLLQSIFEYQTMICELTGMDVSNASVYDGATAAAGHVPRAQAPGDPHFRRGPPRHHQHRPHLLLRHRRRAARGAGEGRQNRPGGPGLHAE